MILGRKREGNGGKWRLTVVALNHLGPLLLGDLWLRHAALIFSGNCIVL